MRLDAIPAGRLRDQVVAQLAADEAARNRARAGATTGGHEQPAQAVVPSPRLRRCSSYRCAGRRGCGRLSPSYAAAQRHADEHGGARIDCVL